MTSKHGTAFSTGVRTVKVFDGPRGPQGFPGEEGEQGPPGESISVRGAWQSGATYCPLDAVTWRSTAVDGVDSLYIQRSAVPCSASTVPPHEDAARWDELGAVSFGNAFGGIWEVFQVNHGFQHVGTPVAFDFATVSYIMADADAEGELGVCVVREVLDSDRVVLQSTGEVPHIDSRVIWPDGTDWIPGHVYYVSSVRGRVQETPPDTMGSWSNPILMATDAPSPGARNGIALPWSPVGADPTPTRVLVGLSKFHYVATDGQDTFTGPDRDGKVLAYTPGEESNEVFIQGLNQDDTTYTMADGVSVGISTPATAGDLVEIWAAAQPTTAVVASTLQKLDDISDDFNGATTVFPMLVAGVPVALNAATTAMITLDMFVQEPDIDFTVVEDPDNPGLGYSALSFNEPPPGGTRFYGLLFEPAPPAPTVLQSIEWLMLSVDAATGVRHPVDPMNQDPFDSITSALEWVHVSFSRVSTLYLELQPGVYNERPPNWLAEDYDYVVPPNVWEFDIYGLGATKDDVVINLPDGFYWFFNHSPFWGGNWTTNCAGMNAFGGYGCYVDVAFNVSATHSFASFVVDTLLYSSADLTITFTAASGNTGIALRDISGDSNTGAITVNCNRPMTIPIDVYRASHYDGSNNITINGADAGAVIRVREASTFRHLGTLTGATIDRVSSSGVLRSDLP